MRSIAATVLLTLAAAAPAAAQSESIALPYPAAPSVGPAWAGERTAWVAFNRVFVREPAGAVRQVDAWTIRDQPLVTGIAGSASRIAVSRSEEGCGGDGFCRGDFQPTLSEIRSGPPAGPLGARPTCTRALPIVTESVLGVRCPGGVTILSDESGESGRTFGPKTGIELAVGAVEGPYVAYATGYRETARLVLADRRTGDEIFSVAAQASDVDVDADGTVAYAAPDAGGSSRAFWASPAEPFPHDLGVLARQVRIERGRVVASTGINSENNVGPATLTALTLDGRRLGAMPGRSGFDLAGGRVVTSIAPCRIAFLQVWDLAASPPPSPGRGCAVPRIASRALRFDRRGVARVIVACPAGDTGGCGGTLGVRTTRPCRATCPGTISTYFGMPAGTRRRVVVVDHGSLVPHLRRTSSRRAQIHLEAHPTDTVLRRVVPVRLPPRRR
jgi:hypothetical protein